jgi:hypothetical protein
MNMKKLSILHNAVCNAGRTAKTPIQALFGCSTT